VANVGTVRLDTRELDAIARHLDLNTDDAVEAIARQVEALAKSTIVAKDIIDTGALLGSIAVTKQGTNSRWVHDGVEYGVYHELGTHRIGARPFMTPAVEAVNREVADIVKKELFP